MVNRTIKNFEIKELIATGGMAAIYKAVQVSLERVVAIKILHGHLAQDKDFITRFEREAKAAANLKHENIVNIIDYGKAEDIYFIAMEYVEGKSLKDLINSVKFIPHDMALMIAYEISQGLNHAHQKGGVKIADFGLAQAQDLTSITVTGAIVGTPAYMSPEQAGGKKVDYRSDIFSLGVVIYEMITGIKPFRGENYSSIIHEILTVVPSKPFEANPLISKEISEIIERMLVKDPEQRCQNIAEISDSILTYFRKLKIEISRRDIGEFIKSPAEQFQALLQKRKEKHYERGLYFMSLGDEKINEAIGEFEKILHLDPQDTRATKYISDLKERRIKRDIKTAARDKKEEKQQKKKLPKSLAMVGGVVLLAILLFAFVKLPHKNAVPSVEPAMILGVANVSSSPEGADIYIDKNKENATTPGVIDSLANGRHTIELRKVGYKPFAQDFEIKGGDTFFINHVMIKEVVNREYNRIIVKSTPPGASVFIDNTDFGKKTPCTIESIVVGQHKIKLVKPGFETVELDRVVSSQKPLTLTITLTSISKPVIGTSYLKITVVPWAKIYVDDRYVETTPIAGSLTVSSGAHIIRLENPNFKIWQKKYEFEPSRTVNLDVKLDPIEGHLKLTVKPWADIYIDGKYYETTPIGEPIKLPAGKHVLKLVNPTYQIYEETIAIPANKMLKKTVELVSK